MLTGSAIGRQPLNGRRPLPRSGADERTVCRPGGAEQTHQHGRELRRAPIVVGDCRDTTLLGKAASSR